MLSKLTFPLAFVVMLIFTLSFLPTLVLAQQQSANVVATTDNEFTLISKATTDGTTVGATNGLATASTADTNMPDLDDLLRLGGTIELSIAVDVDEDATNNNTFSFQDDAKAADVAGFKHRVIISEVMWGLNATP